MTRMYLTRSSLCTARVSEPRRGVHQVTTCEAGAMLRCLSRCIAVERVCGCFARCDGPVAAQGWSGDRLVCCVVESGRGRKKLRSSFPLQLCRCVTSTVASSRLSTLPSHFLSLSFFMFLCCFLLASLFFCFVFLFQLL